LVNAAGHGDAATVRTLLAKGVEVNARRNDGVTALMGASFNGRDAVVRQLIAKGAEVNAKDNQGGTALTAAKNADIRALLVQSGAKP
jgi:uncharacterized protein